MGLLVAAGWDCVKPETVILPPHDNRDAMSNGEGCAWMGRA